MAVRRRGHAAKQDLDLLVRLAARGATTDDELKAVRDAALRIAGQLDRAFARAWAEERFGKGARLRVPLPRRTCRGCGKTFAVPTDRSRRIFCTNRCRVAYRRRAKDRLAHIVRGGPKGVFDGPRPRPAQCAVCGREFRARGRARYCTQACRQRAYRERKRQSEAGA